MLFGWIMLVGAIIFYFIAKELRKRFWWKLHVERRYDRLEEDSLQRLSNAYDGMSKREKKRADTIFKRNNYTKSIKTS
jgi:hypothetical protein